MTSTKQGFAQIVLLLLGIGIIGVVAFIAAQNKQETNSSLKTTPTASPELTQKYLYQDDEFTSPNPNWRKFTLPNCQTEISLPPAYWSVTEHKKEGTTWTWYQMNGMTSSNPSDPVEFQFTCDIDKQVAIVNECKNQDGSSKLTHFTIAGNKATACYEINAKKLQPFSVSTQQGKISFYAFGFDEPTLRKVFESFTFSQ